MPPRSRPESPVTDDELNLALAKFEMTDQVPPCPRCGTTLLRQRPFSPNDCIFVCKGVFVCAKCNFANYNRNPESEFLANLVGLRPTEITTIEISLAEKLRAWMHPTIRNWLKEEK